jgi:3-dehydroquinate synthase
MDEHTFRHCFPFIEPELPVHQNLIVPAGEQHKNLETCLLVWQKLTEYEFDRYSLLLILGGGVLGDLGGFCASTYKRGIDFVIMPTTLLAQVDASVGGKLGIDFQHYKNHLGLFREPTGTLIAFDFLKTLPLRELRSGFAEIIKHSLISDRAMWDKLRSRPLEDQPWEELIYHSVAFKYSIVSQDPKETGLRKILNFGHTMGHALESYFLSQGNRIFHGEAIAAGMVSEAFIAQRKNLIEQDELDQISRYLIQIFGKIKAPVHNHIMPFIANDKKNKEDKINMSLPERIGNAVWDVEVSEHEIIASLEYYSSR